MSPGGLVLDLSPLKGVSVDAEGRTARVEAGLTTQARQGKSRLG